MELQFFMVIKLKKLICFAIPP